ncbi:MAG: hypothetical protein A3K60_07085 [Euryarchaeota archaeon RBG_19FT_COMBO_56_21]|nr:MAG: hypothetical protein A3K60_07085 [Euryarchaeota archaeon RBG_19FT_COMBO_56_21]
MVLLIFLLIVALMASSIKTILPYEGALYFRRGRYIRVLNPGIRLVVPLVGEIHVIDMRTKAPRNHVLDEIITADGGPLSLVLRITYQIKDIERAFFGSANYENRLYEVAGDALLRSAMILRTEEFQSQLERTAVLIKREIQSEADRLGLKIAKLELAFPSSTPSPPSQPSESSSSGFNTSRPRKLTVPKKR